MELRTLVALDEGAVRCERGRARGRRGGGAAVGTNSWSLLSILVLVLVLIGFGLSLCRRISVLFFFSSLSCAALLLPVYDII